MKLFFYYAFHSVKNQIRKLFKSWVLIFLVACMVIGGLMGYGASKLEELGDDPGQVEVTPDEAGETVEIEIPGVFPDPETPGGFGLQLAELIAGAVVLGVLLFEVVSADKNGSRIFQPADVNLLFAAPMRPQSVLMFRLVTQMGAAILASVYLLFQLPNLMGNMGLSLWSALGVIAAWILTVIVGRLLQTLLYIVCANHPGAKPYLRYAVYVLLALITAGYFLYWQRSGEEPLAAAMLFFNDPVTRYIPVWGWLKGVAMFSMESSLMGTLLCAGAVGLTIAVLLLVIRRLKADFYEDAMAKSEEMAELMERARAQKSGVVFGKRKKDRGDGLRRDGLNRGAGASMFFHKALYNRFRFGHLGYFTKTAETYLVTAVGMALLSKLVFRTDGATGLILVSLILGVFAFYRTLGNPLEQDTKMDYFRLVPESIWAKLLYSLLGGTVNCLLDLLPGMIAAVLILGANPLTALAWLAFVVSVDFYGTCVGTFIGLSTPSAAGKTVKQIIQIMFLYFGLVPNAVIMAVALVMEHAMTGIVGCTAVNVLLGLVFYALSPLFLAPRSRASAPVRRSAALGESDRRTARRAFSRLGLSIALIMPVATVSQLLLVKALDHFASGWRAWPYSIWLMGFGTLYLVGIPLGLLAARRMPTLPPEKGPMTAGRYLCIILICIFMMQAGNVAGLVIQSVVERLVGVMPANPIETFANDESLLLRIVFLVILAPLIEEFIFRKTLIDRMRPYGEKLAVVTSAMMFGLFHGNLSQMFYAFSLGLVFGYVYLRTGKLRYTVGLHMLINLFGGVVSVELYKWASSGLGALEKLGNLDPSALMESGSVPDLSAALTPGVIALGLYSAVLMSCAVAGLVLLIVRSRRVRFEPVPLELPRDQQFKTVYLNVGMLLFVAICLASVVSTFVIR